MDRLVFAVLSDSLAEIRRVPARCGRDVVLGLDHLKAHFTVWERGVLVNAACFLLDFPRVEIEIPLRAFAIAQRVVALEAGGGWLDELAAAAMAGAPWRSFFPAECLHCQRSGTWRQMLFSPETPPEIGWRYERPENHIPLCRRCVSRLAYRDPTVQKELARAVWGARFEALLEWHSSIEANSLPDDWDRASYPLWPEQFGGLIWSTGSGKLEHAEPVMFYGVQRTRQHREHLVKCLGQVRATDLMYARPPAESESIFPTVDASTSQIFGAAS